jgi:hypothetical protein
MGVLAGPFAAAAILLAVAGVLKFHRPEYTANALRAAGFPHSRSFVRAFGAGEAVIAVGALTIGHPLFALMVGASYLAFAGFVLVALTRDGAVSSCGCFGEPDTPATSVHVVLDIAAAIVAFAVAMGGGSDWLGVLREQPLGAVPFVVLTITCAYLGYVVLTVLPQTSRRAT